VSAPIIIETTKLPTSSTRIPGFHMVNAVTHPDEWRIMWNALVLFWKGDTADYNASFGECWQYMGTVLRADTWEHVFRHRMHPRTGRREYFRVLATVEFHSTHPLPTKTTPRSYERAIPAFDPTQCSGAFDGLSMSSDADSGL
jgi:hypothetical protein